MCLGVFYPNGWERGRKRRLESIDFVSFSRWRRTPLHGGSNGPGHRTNFCRFWKLYPFSTSSTLGHVEMLNPRRYFHLVINLNRALFSRPELCRIPPCKFFPSVWHRPWPPLSQPSGRPSRLGPRRDRHCLSESYLRHPTRTLAFNQSAMVYKSSTAPRRDRTAHRC